MANIDSPSTLDKALRQFEATEANLGKLERIWKRIWNHIPGGLLFFTSSEPDYEDACRTYEIMLKGLPSIDGWKPTSVPAALNEIAQARLDAQEIDEIQAGDDVEKWIESPGRELREYRFHLNQKRRHLIRQAITQVADEIDLVLEKLILCFNDADGLETIRDDPDWDLLKDKVLEFATLIGSSVPRPPKWNDLHRHLHFGQVHDLRDIATMDWPSIKGSLNMVLYSEDEPIPIEVTDLGELVDSKPSGPIVMRLRWDSLSAEDFERLIFALLNTEEGYENPEWLMKTNAPDKGRDLSVSRVIYDGLSGVSRKRVIIQCKHWQNQSISPAEIALLKEQVKLWEPPRIDFLIIATTGRFTADAVALIEKHNYSNTALTIEMWPESHLEKLLALRPGLIAEFNLR